MNPTPNNPSRPPLLDRLRELEQQRDRSTLKQLAAELLKARWRVRRDAERSVDPTSLG